MYLFILKFNNANVSHLFDYLINVSTQQCVALMCKTVQFRSMLCMYLLLDLGQAIEQSCASVSFFVKCS